MTPRQPNRLEAGKAQHLMGSEIDRARPLRFRLDGRMIEGFAGDTIFSAAMASGIIGVGKRSGQVLGLDAGFCPPVVPRYRSGGPHWALPMERTPAIEGLDLVTTGDRGGSLKSLAGAARALMPGAATSLGKGLDVDAAFARPWVDLPPQVTVGADLVVVGGGLAGLSAALAAGRAGARVVLIERSQTLGGNALFYGNVGEEEAPETLIARAEAALAGLENVRILKAAEAFALFEHTVLVHHVEAREGVLGDRVIAIRAPRLVLATGMIERLPVFPGNRLPGIVGAQAAFQRARLHGVWIGKRAALATSTSFSYRVGLQAKAAGIAFKAIIDTRADPQSRFIDFAKAYGIPLNRALMPVGARMGKRGAPILELHLAATMAGTGHTVMPLLVDQMVVSGGWAPDLGLWHVAGGRSRWHTKTGRLEATGECEGIALAGAAAGFRNIEACAASGERASAALFGRNLENVEDAHIEALYESADDSTAIAPASGQIGAISYLDWGRSLTERPVSPLAAGFRPWRGGRGRLRSELADQARPLSVGDVAAGVQLGIIPMAEAAIVAEERCGNAGDLVAAGRLHPIVLAATVSEAVPRYLAGRFGPGAKVRFLAAEDGRRLGTGCLIHLNSDETDPLKAIGVVLNHGHAGAAQALVSRAVAGTNAPLFVRDISGPVAVRLIDRAAAATSPFGPQPSLAEPGQPRQMPVETRPVRALPPPAPQSTAPKTPVAKRTAPKTKGSASPAKRKPTRSRPARRKPDPGKISG